MMLFNVYDNGDGKLDLPRFLKLCDSFAAKKNYWEMLSKLQLPKKVTEKCTRASVPFLRNILEHRITEIVMSTLILANAILVITELILSFNQPFWWSWTSWSIDTALLSIFTIEIILRFIAYGCYEFWLNKWNVFDFFVIGLAIIAKIVFEVIFATAALGMTVGEEPCSVFFDI